MYPKSSSPLLLQNCDLPPPLKVFAAGKKPVTAASTNNGICGGGGGELGKSELMKALRRSQTRAREAERRRAQLEMERDRLCRALLEESLQLLAHRQWVRLLELQVSQMRFRLNGGRDDDDDDDGNGTDDGGGTIWAVALALCLGFAFGYKYYF